MFFIGCPMWGYKEWVGNFFPARTPASDFLRIYSRKLNVVEGNTIFYALPSSETIARWCEETPPTFRICPKVSRSISHETRLEDGRDKTLLFVARMRELGTISIRTIHLFIGRYHCRIKSPIADSLDQLRPQ